MSHPSLRRVTVTSLLIAALCLLPISAHALWLPSQSPQGTQDAALEEAPTHGTQPTLVRWLSDALSVIFGQASSTDSTSSSPDSDTTSLPGGTDGTTSGDGDDGGDAGSGLDPSG